MPAGYSSSWIIYDNFSEKLALLSDPSGETQVKIIERFKNHGKSHYMTHDHQFFKDHGNQQLLDELQESIEQREEESDSDESGTEDEEEGSPIDKLPHTAPACTPKAASSAQASTPVPKKVPAPPSTLVDPVLRTPVKQQRKVVSSPPPSKVVPAKLMTAGTRAPCPPEGMRRRRLVPV